MFERPNPELDNALALAESDPQQAAHVLRIAASYLKAGETLPSTHSARPVWPEQGCLWCASTQELGRNTAHSRLCYVFVPCPLVIRL